MNLTSMRILSLTAHRGALLEHRECGRRPTMTVIGHCESLTQSKNDVSWSEQVGWANRSVAPHVTTIHFRVVPGGYVLARILGVSAKYVVSLDLFWLEELYSLVVL